MIVNPQFFNYRLIIGSLIIAVALLTVFSFTSYQSISAQQQFIEQEKNLIVGELSQMIDRYDDVSLSNNLIASNLALAKAKAKTTLDSLKMLRSDLSTLANFRQQLSHLRFKNKSLFASLDSVEQKNEELEKEKRLAYSSLDQKNHTISYLKNKNENLSKVLEKGALMTANSFKANGFQNIFGNRKVSTKAKQVNSFNVCFTLAENALTTKGLKNIYIQILNPKNNVIADKGVVKFGQHSLIYSQKEAVYYNNKVLELCIDVAAENNEQPLLEGTYNISVFQDHRKLGNAQVDLK
jgi:hypothetical protein